MKRRLALLAFKLKMFLAVITTLLLGFGLAYGIAWWITGGSIGGLKLVTWLITGIAVLTILQWLISPYLIEILYRAYEVTPDDPSYGWVYRLVEEVSRANGFKRPPRVFIADIPIPNAFAYGNPIAGKRVAITLPLLRILSKDELKAVLAHEIGHLRHRDVELLMAIGLIPTVLYWLGWSLMWGGWSSENRGNIAPLIGIFLLAFSFIFQLFVLYINRLREIYADINAALTVPNGARSLQRALAKIMIYTDPHIVSRVNGTLRMLFFTIPYEVEFFERNVDLVVEYLRRYKPSTIEELFMTHPHPARRIQILDRFA